MSGWRPALCLSVALAVTACASDPPCGLRACDIRDAECQRMAAEAAACLRGVEPTVVPVVVVSRDDFVAQAEASATTLSPAEAESFRRWNAGLAALKLAPVDNAPGAASAASAAEVDGLYSSKDKQITVIDGGRSLDHWSAVALLVHEYTHAMQDARYDFAQLDVSNATDLDRGLAYRAVVEGEAIYVGDLASAGFYGLASSDIPWPEVLDRWQSSARDRARISPLPVSLSWHHFPYPFGTGFVKGALDVAGWAGVDDLFAALPSGSREVIAGFGSVEPAGGAWAEDLGSDAVPILDTSFEYVGAERMGAWLLEVFLNRIGIYLRSDNLSRWLRGDVFSVFHHRITGGAIAFWRLRASSTDAPYELEVALSMLPAARKESAGDDIVIVAASDATTLEWVPFGPFYQPLPPAPPAAAPPAGRYDFGCVHPAR